MNNLFKRRQFLSALGAATTLPLLDSAALLRAATTKPTLHVYPDYGWLRGLGMIPSWGANMMEAWQLYDGARFREEVALAKQIHVNCIRLWIEYSVWKTDPDKVTASFLDAVAGIAENGMKVMPCLFNHWHDKKLDYGGTPAAAASWRWASLGVALATFVAIWAYGQRFGPVEQARRQLRPPRRDYVDALAADLARTNPPLTDVASPVMADAKHRLTDWLGLPVDADDASIREGALRAGLDSSDVEPVLNPPMTDNQVLALGRAAVHVRRMTDRTPARRGGLR